jgi:beta-fructofuranosidase
MEANNFYGERAFGYNGQMTLPREVFIQVYNNVVNFNGSLSQKGPWILIPNIDGTYTCKTLGVRPINEVTYLRQNSNVIRVMSQTFNLTTNFISLNISSSNFELKANINTSSNATAGFVFRRSSDGLEFTTLIYDPISEYLILNRTSSSLIKTFVNTTIYAKHALLTTIINGNTTQKELLSLHIFIDNSLVEVYANNRTAIATHIYPARLNSTGLGYIVGGQGGSVTFSDVSIWSNLKNAFPKRPVDSSITLMGNSDTCSSADLIFSFHSFFFLCYFSFILHILHVLMISIFLYSLLSLHTCNYTHILSHPCWLT